MLAEMKSLDRTDDIWTHLHTCSVFIRQKMQNPEDSDHKKEKIESSASFL